MTWSAAGRPIWRLSELLEGLVEIDADLDPARDPRISALSLDSRALVPGSLFLACQGTQAHGLAFAEEARRRGALAILAELTDDWPPDALADLQARIALPVLGTRRLGERVGAIADRFHGQPSERLEVLGVTGTNGKTSIVHYLAQALAPELSCGLIGTLGEGFAGELRPFGQTTPDAATLHATLADLLNRGARALAMEVSSHALAQSRTAGVRFSHAIFTNLTRDHLDYHGDMAAYGEAKRRLFATPGLRWAILNWDDPFAARILDGLAPEVAVAIHNLDPAASLPARCDLWLCARTIEHLPRGLRLRVASRRGERHEETTLEVGLLGSFNAANLLAVLALLQTRGQSLEQAARAAASVRGAPGRMECFGGVDAPLAVVDYAHTPDALEQALTDLRRHWPGRVLCVMGCGGGRDTGKRPLMGAIAERLSDLLILTDDNPRQESGDAIVADIRAGLVRPEAARVQRQRGLAIRLALTLAGPGDAVLVAGKGHETTQDLGARLVHFSDRAEVVEALREWREGCRS